MPFKRGFIPINKGKKKKDWIRLKLIVLRFWERDIQNNPNIIEKQISEVCL